MYNLSSTQTQTCLKKDYDTHISNNAQSSNSYLFSFFFWFLKVYKSITYFLLILVI